MPKTCSDISYKIRQSFCSYELNIFFIDGLTGRLKQFNKSIIMSF